MFTRKFLIGWWKKVLRSRILHGTPDHSDRGYLYLAMRAFEIRDAYVGKIIVKIIVKFKGWVNETGYTKHLTNDELNVTPGWGA